MKPILTQLSDAAFLAGYRLPDMTFGQGDHLPPLVARPWKLMRSGKVRAALEAARGVRREAAPLLPVDEAALLAVLAAAEWKRGSISEARRHAADSLACHAAQWTAHRLLLGLHLASQDFESAYAYATAVTPVEDGHRPQWDEPVEPVAWHLAAASAAWRLSEWEDVAGSLRLAFPEGPSSMPPRLQEDWFRLAFYRNAPADAVAAASLLIEKLPVEPTDSLLQAMLQQGWTAEALPLYRRALARAPRSELLRRRLVALCIREGAIEEARRLAKPGALRIAV